MECVILAGGFGTRLRPLTFSTPKPLLPLLNRPMITHIIHRLPEEVDRVILAVNYKKDMLEEFFSENADDFRPEIILVEEAEPLGTGGAIKNCEDQINGTFLVFNGDVINSLNLEDIIAFHRSKGGIGTLAVWEVDDPTRFGIIGFDGVKEITRFLEKPQPHEVFSHFINAGSYVLEPEILDQIDPGRKVSIEREVYPFVLDRGLYAYPFEGFWVDAGTREDYLKAGHEIMEFERWGIVRGDETVIHPEAKILPPVLIGSGCAIGNAIVGPHVVLGNNVKIEKDVRTSNSTLMDDVHAHRGAVVQDSILDNGVEVMEMEVVEGTILSRVEGPDRHQSE